jgi:hypothetical protein
VAELGPTGSPCSLEEKAARGEGTCQGCGALIYWVTMRSGKRMPVDRGREQRVVYFEGEWRVLGSYTSHFARCPKAEQFRKAK